MKIIYIVNARIPTEKAHGYQICKMCEEFSRAGVEVELWVPSRKNKINKNAFEYYNFENNFKINYIKIHDFIEDIKYLGRLAVYLQMFWFLLKVLFKKISKDNLIYTRNPEIVWLFKMRGYRVAYECHDWFNKNKKIALFFLKKCDYIISTNNYIKNEFVRHGFEKDKLLVAPNGINLSIFDVDINKMDALERLDLDDNMKQKLKHKKILIYTGSFSTMGKEKGIKEIQTALKILNNKYLTFVAVGGNKDDIKFYYKLAKDLKIEKQCFFYGRKSQEELALWQKISDIMLMPFPKIAHYEYYMTPLKMFEYMASKRPIIASDLPSIKEVLNEKNSFFCRAGDPVDLSKKIKHVLETPGEARNKLENAYKDVKKYTWKLRAEKILNYIYAVDKK